MFRDQDFSGDMPNTEVKPIEEVRTLRARQLPEDGGPIAHPIRPESYVAMDTVCTATVYCKGAEVIRVCQTFQDREGSARACTCAASAMTGMPFLATTSDRRWRRRAAETPPNSRSGIAGASVYTLALKQRLGVRSIGREVVPSRVLEVTEPEHSFRLGDLSAEPVPSLLRDFSAPVKLG